MRLGLIGLILIAAFQLLGVAATIQNFGYRLGTQSTQSLIVYALVTLPIAGVSILLAVLLSISRTTDGRLS